MNECIRFDDEQLEEIWMKQLGGQKVLMYSTKQHQRWSIVGRVAYRICRNSTLFLNAEVAKAS